MNIGCVYSVDDFVSIEKPLATFSSIPFGVSYVATALKIAGFSTHMLVFTRQSDIVSQLCRFIEQYKPRLFCLTAVSSQFHFICHVAKVIKEIDPEINIILGGHHATLDPEDAMSCQQLDAICIGEGERAVVEYARQLRDGVCASGIDNLWLRQGNSTIEKNGTRPFIQELDSLPHIDRHMWSQWIADKQRMPSMLIGRGCPNRCRYCSNHALVKVATGKYVRYRSGEDIIDELNEITNALPKVSGVYLEAETFGMNIGHIEVMCDHLIRFNALREKPLNFGANLVVSKDNATNNQLMQMLSKANITFLNIGLESGSERIRDEVLRRPRYSNDHIIAFCRLAKKYNIAINLFVLLGVPGETPAEFRQTIECVRACEPNYAYLSIFYPYPGTDLYRYTKQLNAFTDEIVDPLMERKRAVLDLPGFSRRQIEREYVLFPYRAYRGNKPLYRILAIMARYYIGMHPRLNAWYRHWVDRGIMKTIKRKLTPTAGTAGT